MTIPIELLVVHFVGDYLLQSDYMALNKSRSWAALTAHVCVYSLCFTPWGWRFALLTWVTHFATDAVTSRLNVWLRARRERYFYIGIGADQLTHAVTLAWTHRLYGGPLAIFAHALAQTG